MQLPLIEPARTEKLLQWHPEENEGVLQRMCRRAVMITAYLYLNLHMVVECAWTYACIDAWLCLSICRSVGR